MALFPRIRHTARLLFRKNQVEAELDEEVRSCLDILTARNIQAGMSPDKARSTARNEIDGVEQIKEQVRDVRTGAVIENVVQDVRYALRMMGRDKGFAAIAVMTLALGIGINTAVFSVLNAVVLAPLPYEEPGALNIIWSAFQKTGAQRAPGSGVELRELQRNTRAYRNITGLWMGNATLTGDSEPEQIKLAFVTWNFFDTLGARPALGSTFTQKDEGAGERPGVIISDGLWRSRFGGDPRVIGKAVRLQGLAATIIGVMPVGFKLYFPPDANIAAEVPAYMAFPYEISSTPRDLYFIRFIGRLKPGFTIQQGQQDLNTVAGLLRERYVEYRAEKLKLQATELQQDAVREVRPGLLSLMIGAGFVLLMGCVNVANLSLARGNSRRKEIAVRASMGASRGRVIRQLLTESLVLAVIAGIAGSGIGWAGVRILTSLRPESLARIDTVGLDPRVLCFVAAISLGSAILFGIMPATEATRFSFMEALREAGRGAGAAGKKQIRMALIVTEVTLGFVLLTGAGLMILSFLHLQNTSPGFDARHVLTFEIELQGHYPTDIDRTNFVKQWEARLVTVPGVESVGAVSHLPLDDYPNWYSPYTPQGATAAQSKNLLADYRAITPGYFRAIGARLTSGRLFTEMDQAATAPVVIVDDLLAKTTWPGQLAVGKRISVEHFQNGAFVPGPAEVVGVVEHIQHHSLTKQVRGQIYIAYPQSSRTHLSYVVRTNADPLGLANIVRHELAQMDRALALSKVRPMTDYVARATAPVSFTTIIAAIFGGLGLLLATIGVYGLISYSISQRTHEVGIRMALGARQAQIIGLILREGVQLVLAGVSIGLVCALTVFRYAQSLLFGVAAFDPLIYFVAGSILVVTSVVACWRPAFRASRGSVVQALRTD